MNTSRRNFIKHSGSGIVATAFLPVLSPLTEIFNAGLPLILPRTSPESQGISSGAISRFIAAANASGIGWHSFILIRHGNVVAEGWWKPFEPGFKHTLYSLSKSFTSTAIGLLVKEGNLKIDTPVISFFPGDTPANPGKNLQEMKISHLLTMNTGHNEDTMPKLRASDKPWTRAFLEQPVNFEPGTHFLYNTGATYMLGAIVHKITGETLEKYLSPRLFQPLDIKGYDWETSPQGLNTAGYGLRVKTDDIAKFGQLYLQNGKWNGKEILTESWVKEATRYQTKSQEGNGDWAQGYGYQFWRCKPGFYRGDGAYGQFCIVMPDQDAVLAVTSESWDMQKSMNIIWDNLLPALGAGTLTENPVDLAVLKKDLKSLALPVVKGSTRSPLSSKYNGKKFTLEKNDFAAGQMQFNFSKSSCSWTTKTGEKETTIEFGWENWLLNKDSALYIFPVPRRLHMPSKIAGTATWLNDHTLQLDARFVEAIHGDKITCRFDGDKISVSFINSLAEHTKDNPEKRMALSGTL